MLRKPWKFLIIFAVLWIAEQHNLVYNIASVKCGELSFQILEKLPKNNLIALKLHMRWTWSFFYFKDKSIRHIFTYFQENIIITYIIMLNYVTQSVTFRLNRLQNDKTLIFYNFWLNNGTNYKLLARYSKFKILIHVKTRIYVKDEPFFF